VTNLLEIAPRRIAGEGFGKHCFVKRANERRLMTEVHTGLVVTPDY